MMARRPGSTRSGSCSGESFNIALASSAIDRPRNGRSPEAMSKSTTPSAQMSLWAVARSPCKTSGLRYAGVPMTTPVAVGVILNSSDEPSPSSSSRLARPKSSTTARPAGVMITLFDLRSR